jgi:multidrug efflux pump subunit AcrA (membrane-fusion protein)
LLPSVEVLAIEPTICTAPVSGYGTVRPKRQVKIIPEVSGRLVFVHANLAIGNVITKGELLFEIDPRPYEMRERQVQAEIDQLGAQLKRQQQEQLSVQERLAVAERQLDLAEQSMERERALLDQDSATAPEMEAAEERYLRHHDVVLEYRSQRATMPFRQEETEALLRIKHAQAEQAALNRQRTKIQCPFDARVESISAHASQAVIANLQIATLTDIEALELSVVIDPRDLHWTDQRSFVDTTEGDDEGGPIARVSWTILRREYSWTGRVMRLERLDAETRTAHVIVEIRDLIREFGEGHAHPETELSVGMFCRAELPARPLHDALIVPRHAIRDAGTVYVFEPEPGDGNRGRLAIKRVPLLRNLGDDVLVAYRHDEAESQPAPDAGPDAQPLCELNPGDRVVVSPLPKAVAGMQLTLRNAGEGVAADTAAARATAIQPTARPVDPVELVLGCGSGAP